MEPGNTVALSAVSALILALAKILYDYATGRQKARIESDDNASRDLRKQYQDRIAEMDRTAERMQGIIAGLQAQLGDLKVSYGILGERHNELQRQTTREIADLRAENVTLRSENQGLRDANARRGNENDALRARLGEA